MNAGMCKPDHALPIDAKIDRLIEDLSQARSSDDLCNPYADGPVNNSIRRGNLRLYLRTMARRGPACLLVMEAPGYRGCRLTGVPVTSRKILLEGLAELNMFGGEEGFRDVDDEGFADVYGEQTATIVWRCLADLRVLPLIWNAFPFHPHKAGLARSNRRPRRAEIDAGAAFLTRIMAIWRFRQVIAVGNVAYDSLRQMGINCDKARHPAHGGKNDFQAALQALLSG